MKVLPISLILLLAVIESIAQTGKTHKVVSPDKLTSFEIRTYNGIRKRTITVKKGDLLPVSLKGKTGQAIIIRSEL